MISPGNRFRPRKSGLALSIALIAALGVPFGAQAEAPGTIQRVSVATGGGQRDKVPTGSTTACGATTVGKCTKRTISADGNRIAFVSRASNLVDGDTNGKADVFLWDNTAVPKVRRINVAGAEQANADSDTPAISPNGRYITFESLATNILPSGQDDNDLVTDVFIYDVQAGTLSLASVPADANAQSNQASFSSSVADDGSVSFTSFATNLTAKAPGQFQNVFVRKTAATPGTAKTILVSQAGTAPAFGVAADGPSKESTISADGTKISFTSAAKNLGGTEAEATDDIFVATVGADLSDIKRITTASGNDAQSYMSAISSDGSKVAFVSDGIDSDGRKDIFTASTSSGSPSLASDCGPCAGSNPNTDRPAVVPAIANSGAIVFQSAARFSPVNSTQVWVKSGNVAMASTPANSTAGANIEAEYASISDSGQFVSFTSAANNLVPGDANGAEDIFRKDMTTGELVRVSVGAGGKEASGFAVIPQSGPTLSQDGRFVAFDSDSSNLIGPDGDKNGLNDIFYRDRENGDTKRISNGLNGEESNGSSRNPVMSADGRYVVFESTAANLVAGDGNGVTDVFVWDKTNNSINILSRAGTTMGDQESTRPHISPNGQWVVFESLAAIAQPVFPGVRNVMRVSLANGPANTMPELVTKQHNNNNKPGYKSVSQDSFGATVANDGTVAFLTRAKSLAVPNDPDTVNGNGVDKMRNYTDVLATRGGTLSADFVRVSQDADGSGTNPDGTETTVANNHSTEAIISADGRKVAFTSLASNLTSSPDNNTDSDVFLRDIAGGTTALVSQGLGRSNSPSLSGDGGLVAFVSMASNIVSDDTNVSEDVFVGSPGTQAVRMSMASDGSQAMGGGSYYPSMSANGQSVGFASVATNLVGDDTNDAFDHFVRDINGFVPQPCAASGCGGGGGGGIVVPKGTAYRFVAADGGIFNFGEAKMFGSLGGTKLNKPIVAMSATPSNQGYWLVASDGGVFSFGDAAFYGSTGAIKLNSPIVAMATTPTGKGYWFVAADGGIFGFGDAAFYGSMGGKPLNKPIVAMAPTSSGKGYWLVASDGGIFSFGDAKFFGSTGNITLNKPIVGMDRSATGNGYRFVASDGGIFSFGDASFLGSMGDKVLNKPIVGMAKARSGEGYYLVASDGGIFAFGSAAFAGSTGNIKLNSPIVGMAG